MTTPANPTPEPTPLTDAEEVKSLCEYGPEQSQEARIAAFDFARDLERQLSDTRRRLAEVEKGAKINTHVRLFDLVRYQRSELHHAGLITDEEYAWLCTAPMAMSPKGGSPSRQRLEDYDELQEKLTALRNAADGMQAVLLSSIDALSAAYSKANAEQAGDTLTAQQCLNEQDEWRNQRDAALAAYAALISEGAGKP